MYYDNMLGYKMKQVCGGLQAWYVLNYYDKMLGYKMKQVCGGLQAWYVFK
jgi:hypothetical protein